MEEYEWDTGSGSEGTGWVETNVVLLVLDLWSYLILSPSPRQIRYIEGTAMNSIQGILICWWYKYLLCSLHITRPPLQDRRKKIASLA